MTYQPNHLNPPPLKLIFQLRKRAQLGRAHGREIRRVREQNCPLAIQPFVEIDVALGGLCLEVGRLGADADAWLLGGRGEEAAESGRFGGAEGGERWVGGGGVRGAQGGAREEGCHDC